MIKQYIIYKSNGEILRTGTCSEGDFNIQAKDDEFILEGIADSATQYIENEAIVNMPIKPGVDYFFDYSNKKWVFNKNLAELKAKATRNRLLAEGPDRISPVWWSSMSEQEQQAWTQYRQDLLDITKQADYPEFIVWPIKP